MCRDRECSISNTTPCVFVFKVGLSIPKKNETKKKPKASNNDWWAQTQSSGHTNSGWSSTNTTSWNIGLNKKSEQGNLWNKKSLEENQGSFWNKESVDPKELLSLSEEKQKSLNEFNLYKKTMISNTIREIKKKDDVWRGS